MFVRILTTAGGAGGLPHPRRAEAGRLRRPQAVRRGARRAHLRRSRVHGPGLGRPRPLQQHRGQHRDPLRPFRGRPLGPHAASNQVAIRRRGGDGTPRLRAQPPPPLLSTSRVRNAPTTRRVGNAVLRGAPPGPPAAGEGCEVRRGAAQHRAGGRGAGGQDGEDPRNPRPLCTPPMSPAEAADLHAALDSAPASAECLLDRTTVGAALLRQEQRLTLQVLRPDRSRTRQTVPARNEQRHLLGEERLEVERARPAAPSRDPGPARRRRRRG